MKKPTRKDSSNAGTSARAEVRMGVTSPGASNSKKGQHPKEAEDRMGATSKEAAQVPRATSPRKVVPRPSFPSLYPRVAAGPSNSRPDPNPSSNRVVAAASKEARNKKAAANNKDNNDLLNSSSKDVPATGLTSPIRPVRPTH